ncbi:hypothetical protein AKL15_11695 [Corynebacterium glutamicum]|nr:hypothetical protein AKL15_11695 [Corynebacterium glutamicum]QDX79125.1 hypothetical protein AKL16_11700 [Corynebacterium glutamicum]TWS33175.1 hypothetical protein AKJ19_10210 [Corynebacterium glutamicum]TWS40675.1 hypothetical protein AKJ24_10210 [Corynebacterium glutamicum]TWS41342.1 hypothetical protein AKJ23_10215 [Corynebacterium glutamicum]
MLELACVLIAPWFTNPWQRAFPAPILQYQTKISILQPRFGLNMQPRQIWPKIPIGTPRNCPLRIAFKSL